MQLPRFYPIVDTARIPDWPEVAREAVAGGAEILQIRHKGLWTEEMIEAAARVKALGALLIINDRADIAAMLGVGVHVGQDDLPAAGARRLVAGPVGLSTHNEEQLRAAAAEPVDYAALGPIFPTASKANPDPVVGLAALARWRPLLSRPLVAIGGITRLTARAVIEAGADTVAVIGDWDRAADRRERVREWVQLLK